MYTFIKISSVAFFVMQFFVFLIMLLFFAFFVNLPIMEFFEYANIIVPIKIAFFVWILCITIGPVVYKFIEWIADRT